MTAEQVFHGMLRSVGVEVAAHDMIRLQSQQWVGTPSSK